MSAPGGRATGGGCGRRQQQAVSLLFTPELSSSGCQQHPPAAAVPCPALPQGTQNGCRPGSPVNRWHAPLLTESSPANQVPGGAGGHSFIGVFLCQSSRLAIKAGRSAPRVLFRPAVKYLLAGVKRLRRQLGTGEAACGAAATVCTLHQPSPPWAAPRKQRSCGRNRGFR